MSANETQEIRVHLCTSADRAEQAELVNACFKKKVDAKALAWRYDENPHGASVSFLSRVEGKAVCGYACSPRMALAHGNVASRAPIGETGDVMTHPDWRKRGLFSALDRAAISETKKLGWPVIFGLPNRRSAHIFVEQLGWSAVGTVRPWTFLFRADAASRAARRREGRVRGWMASHAARKCARLRRAAADSARPLKVEELTRIPPEVGAISRQVSRDFALMVERDADWLTWRFLESPSRLHRVLGVRAEDNSLQGYSVVQLPRPGEAHGYVVDLLAFDAGAEAAAMEAALSRLEQAGASYAEATAIDGSWWSHKLASTGFLAPKPENHLSVIVHANKLDHPLSVAARTPKLWYFTDGDRDDETMG
jgi:GNAT superfamily N-acetyltransferase